MSGIGFLYSSLGRERSDQICGKLVCTLVCREVFPVLLRLLGGGGGGYMKPQPALRGRLKSKTSVSRQVVLLLAGLSGGGNISVSLCLLAGVTQNLRR